MTGPRCRACSGPAEYELLTPDGTAFTPALYQCAFGIRAIPGRKRRLTPEEFGFSRTPMTTAEIPAKSSPSMRSAVVMDGATDRPARIATPASPRGRGVRRSTPARAGR